MMALVLVKVSLMNLVLKHQLEGGSFDRQYFHLSVPVYLTESLHLSDQYIFTWDPLHKGGVVDNHIREESSFSWLVEIQTSCGEILSIFNWGKNYEIFFANLQRFGYRDEKTNKLPEEKFANSVHFVFVDYLAVRLALVNLIASN